MTGSELRSIPSEYTERSAPIRVCFVAESFHPVVGGMETQARLLAQRLVARGHRVLVVTRRNEPGLPHRETIDGAEIVRVGPAGSGGAKRWPMIATATAALVARRNDFDLAVVLGFRSLGLIGPILGALGKPCILKAESNGEMSGAFFDARLSRFGLSPAAVPIRLAVRVRNRLLRRADAFVAISTAVETEMQSAGIDPSRIFRIPNAVDADRFHPPTSAEKSRCRQALGFAPDERIFVYTGRLVRYKGLPLLLRSWSRVLKEAAGVRLVLVGTGGQDIDNCESELREFVDQQGIQSAVTFTGPVENVHDYLMAADAFVFPTQNEAFGLSLVEAMSCGLPVLASPVGGVPDIVTDGVDGVLVPEFEESQWTRHMLRLLAEPGEATRLGVAARRSVLARFTADSVTDAYEVVFENCLRASGRSAR